MVATIIASAFTWAGCTTDQRADIAAYRSVSDPPGVIPTHEPGTPLTLVDALRLTAAHNEQLASSGEQYVQALAARQRAAAGLRPTIDLFGGASYRSNDDSGNDDLQTEAGASGQYRLLTGGGDRRTVHAADARADARRWLILDLRETLLLQTARAYYDTLLAEKLASVLQSSVQVQLERLSDATARNEVGFTRPLDVSQIEAQVSRTRAQLILADRQRDEARSALALLTNADARTSPLTDGFFVPQTDAGTDQLLLVAQQHRQDVLAARAEADAARSLVDAAISEYSPAISINLDYFLASGTEDSGASLAALVQARVPVFSAGRIEAGVRSAWSVFRERVLDYRLRVREARRDLETALTQLHASRRRAEELHTQVNVARQSLVLAEAAYEAGLGTNLERITAQDDLLNAELQAASEEFATKTAYLALSRACGLLSHDLLGAAIPEPPAHLLVPPSAPLLDRAPAP